MVVDEVHKRARRIRPDLGDVSVRVGVRAITRGFWPRLPATKSPVVPSLARPAAKMLRPAGWYAATSVCSRKLMSVRVSGAPAVRHSRWLSATAGAMSAWPVGYDQDTRVLVAKYPEGKRLRPVEHRDRVEQHPIARR